MCILDKTTSQERTNLMKNVGVGRDKDGHKTQESMGFVVHVFGPCRPLKRDINIMIKTQQWKNWRPRGSCGSIGGREAPMEALEVERLLLKHWRLSGSRGRIGGLEALVESLGTKRFLHKHWRVGGFYGRNSRSRGSCGRIGE